MKNNPEFLENGLFEVNSVNDMIALGQRFGELLEAYDALALTGDLGAGKTHFTKGIAQALGCSSPVSSPTFPLVHEYQGGKLPLFHFDFYRLESGAELEAIGWDEYLDTPGIIIAEWANKFPEYLPEHTVNLRFEVTSPTQRRVYVTLS